jgi:hypothetical protein
MRQDISKKTITPSNTLLKHFHILQHPKSQQNGLGHQTFLSLRPTGCSSTTGELFEKANKMTRKRTVEIN